MPESLLSRSERRTVPVILFRSDAGTVHAGPSRSFCGRKTWSWSIPATFYLDAGTDRSWRIVVLDATRAAMDSLGWSCLQCTWRLEKEAREG